MSRASIPATILRVSAVAGLLLVTAALITGCGSSKPAKPAYCSEVTKFKDALGKLKDTGSPSALASNISNVVTTGQAAVSAVKSAFAPQTAALKTSLQALATSGKELLSAGSRAAALQQLPSQITAVKSAGQAFVNAAHPKCS